MKEKSHMSFVKVQIVCVYACVFARYNEYSQVIEIIGQMEQCNEFAVIELIIIMTLCTIMQ